MREQIIKTSAAILLICFACSSCAYMTKSGRQQMAYRHYVRKHIRERQRRIARATAQAERNPKRQRSSIQPSAPIVNANVQPVQPMAEPTSISPSTVSESSDAQPKP
jgi:Na+-translocating ferredoxin:NAD+ oxidoreductase RnfC subunit